jgi:uncharacterized protein YkwD
MDGRRRVTLLVAGALLVTASPAVGASTKPTRVEGWSTSPTELAVDEAVTREVTVRTGRRTPPRRVLLQFRPAQDGRWGRLDVTTSDRTGVAVLTAEAPGAGWLRVKVPATSTARAATTARAPVTTTSVGDDDPTGWTASAFEAEVLRLTNQIRATGTTCGAREYGPKPPLTAHPDLGRAAREYARRMGEEGFFAHVSPSGDDPGDRAESAGYDWSSYGENIAAGYDTPAEVVQGWHDSVGHCRNLMGGFAHLGVGYADVDDSRYGSYWVQLFGTPRR